MADDAPWNDYKTEASPATADDAPWNDYKSAAPAKPQGQWGPLSEALNGVLMGAGPTLTGAGQALRGNDFGQAKAASEQARDAYEAANPKTALAASAAGGVVPAVAAGALGVPALVAGAVMGAAPGAFNGDPTQAVMGGALGTAGTAAAGLLGKAATGLGRMTGFVPPAAPTAAAVPTMQQALDLGGQQFNDLRATGATFPATDVRGAATDTAANLDAAGKVNLPGLAPTAHSLLDKMGQMGALEGPPQTQFTSSGMSPIPGPGTPAVPVGIAELDAMRKAFGNVRPSGSTSMTDVSASRAGSNAILDLFAHNPQVADLSANARGNSAAGMMARDLGDYAENAANGAQNTGVGMNVGNKFRQAAGAAVKSDDFDHVPDVRAALQATNDGTGVQNLLRRVGTTFGGGGGPLSLIAPALAAGAAGVAGHEAAGLPGLLAATVPLAIGHMAKTADGNMAKAAFDNAVQTALKRSPAYADNVANFVPPATGGLGSVFGNAMAPAIGAATANPGMGALFGN